MERSSPAPAELHSMAAAANPSGGAAGAGNSLQASAEAAALRFEREMLEALNPGAQAYRGRRLLELCKEELTHGLPRMDEAFAYGWQWARSDPEGMFNWFRSEGPGDFIITPPDGQSGHNFLSLVFGEWAKRDSARAVAAALSLESRATRRGALAAIIKSLRARDPGKASAILAEHAAEMVPPPGSRFPFNADAEEGLANLAMLKALPDSRARTRMLAAYLNTLAIEQPSETAAFWNSQSMAEKRQLLNDGFFLTEATGYNDWDVLRREETAASGDAGKLAGLLENDIRRWAENDPASAIAWSMENLKGAARINGAAMLFRAGAGRHFDETLAVWQSLPEGSLRARAAGQLADGAPRERQAEVKALIATLSPADQAIALAAMGQDGRSLLRPSF